MKFDEKVRVFTDDIDAAATPVLRVAKLGLTHDATKIPSPPTASPGQQWYQLEVWLQGPDEVRQDVKDIVYTLHPTFDPNEVTRSTPLDFRLRLQVWGAFTVKALVRFKDGYSINLARFLSLTA
jgi:transcription initiation factor IIF auxiliary subunit